MGSSMGKTTLREIRQSLGRYFAIMAIVALGVGLFSGLLKVTRDVMVSSAQLYFDQTSFYDVELISTVGFETDAARQLSCREGVLDAQGLGFHRRAAGGRERQRKRAAGDAAAG